MTQAANQPASYPATLRFLAPSATPPVYRASQAGADAELELDGEFEDHGIVIENARLRRSLSIDREAFQLVGHASAVQDFYDGTSIESAYSSEIEALVQQATGAVRVHCFDHTRRAESRGARGRLVSREPSAVVHNDYTDMSGPQRVRDIMGDKAEDLLKRRFAIVNVWRPINHPAETSMLAICDAASTRLEDLIPTPRIARDRVGELMLAHHHADQRWCAFPAMRPDEALLLKTYDSATDGRARYAIHTAFDNPNPPATAKPRESIESRVFVFY